MAEFQDNESLIKHLQQELEFKSQALYDCERQKKAVDALLVEYQEELTILQAHGTLEDKKCEIKIQQLEENSLSLKNGFNERLMCLENELANKDKEINKLKHELDEIIKTFDRQQCRNDDKLLEEISHLKEKNHELLCEVSDLTKICENKENEISTLYETTTHHKNDLEEYKEILDLKKVELDEANTLVQTLRDECTVLKIELDSMKAKPLDDKSRGNSLFAEVDDRRVQLQQNMNHMKTQYLEMKRERASHLKQIAVLRNENANILARWESQINEEKDDKDMILLSYKNQIRTLNEVVESYRKESKKEVNCNENSLKMFNIMLDSKNEEIEALKLKLTSTALNENILSHDLAKARREIRKFKLEILKLQNDIGQLQTTIEESKFDPPENPSVEEKFELKSIIKRETKVPQIEVIDLDATENENSDTKTSIGKEVQFTEDSIVSNVTTRRCKRGVKTLVSKPIHISSTSKIN